MKANPLETLALGLVLTLTLTWTFCPELDNFLCHLKTGHIKSLHEGSGAAGPNCLALESYILVLNKVSVEIEL